MHNPEDAESCQILLCFYPLRKTTHLRCVTVDNTYATQLDTLQFPPQNVLVCQTWGGEKERSSLQP